MTDAPINVLPALRMIASLGHGCGLVDYDYTYKRNAPILPVLERLAEVSPYLVETLEWQDAVARAKGERR